MANSGIIWIDAVFDWCVRLLYEVAGMMGITYEEINVYLFVIIGPLAFLASLALNIFLIAEKRRSLRSDTIPAAAQGRSA